MEASYYFIHSWRKTIKYQYRKGSTSSFKIYFKNATGQSMMAHAPPTNTWEAVVDQYTAVPGWLGLPTSHKRKKV